MINTYKNIYVQKNIYTSIDVFISLYNFKYIDIYKKYIYTNITFI